ncbi:hypothetical protein C8J44_0013 [Sphingomonas sp. PP-CE-3A-406]|uniref:hypothetical protein n=1 Tax=unclassified Sphingomonas TaxID=196159 RepID=UPI000713480B|nr:MULTISPECIES: hypothetical protein [unclassified Sphingomonas]KQO08972.1 hypothetical protein ASF09_04520 [Sphingomonas sp. Leaf242]RMB39196.1 hypothetical protein C8J47_0120 [Sphingomonas sp. PP-F2F-G114-C0414]RMB54790.1 hypothetical protein C8J44_0013 [Sphingomonas sp. PP-CE-3A-406]
MHKIGMTFWVASLTVLAGACSPSSPSQPHTSETAAPQPASTNATAAALPVSSIPADPRTIAVNVQGVAPVGVTLRVKSVELGTDATTLDVSASYGGTITNSLELAGNGTYLLAANGDRLMLKPPQDNQSLRITRGQTMDGKLVFLGAVAPDTKSIKLVVNDNNDGNSIISPGLTMTIPLDGTPR